MQKQLLGQKRQSTHIILFLIGFLLSINTISKGFFSLLFVHVGFWMLEIVYISIFSYFILKIYITKHKKLAMYIMAYPILIIEIIFFFFPDTKHKCDIKYECNELTDKDTFEYIVIRFGAYFIPLLFILYEICTAMRDYSWVKSKYLMDIRSVPPYKILMYFGIIGSSLIVICYIIFTNVPCRSFGNVTLDTNNNYINIDSGEEINFLKEYCLLKRYNEKTNILNLYYDSFSSLIDDYKNMKSHFYTEIFVVIPLYLLASLINNFSYIFMIRYSDANNILISKNFYYFIKRIIVMIINIGDEKYITILKFFVFEIQEIISIISNMIYIEIIELRFCKLDYELKKNIKNRSDTEYSITSSSFEFGLKNYEEKNNNLLENSLETDSYVKY